MSHCFALLTKDNNWKWPISMHKFHIHMYDKMTIVNQMNWIYVIGDFFNKQKLCATFPLGCLNNLMGSPLKNNNGHLPVHWNLFRQIICFDFEIHNSAIPCTDGPCFSRFWYQRFWLHLSTYIWYQVLFSRTFSSVIHRFWK